MIELHVPVMVPEVLEALITDPAGLYGDLTTGTGGHLEAIQSRLLPKGRLIALDQNPAVLEIARGRLKEGLAGVRFIRGSFDRLDALGLDLAAEPLDGALLDLGLNSRLLETSELGLSYSYDGPLDMRVDPDLDLRADQLLKRATLEELTALFREEGDLRRAPLYARRIVDARGRAPLATTFDLVRALRGPEDEPLSPAELSRCFQALRVRINDEVGRLRRFLEQAPGWIRPGGRLVILTYQSHEDRVIKELLHGGPEAPFQPLSKKPLAPTPEEVRRNSRARSVKLRGYARRAA